MVWPVIDPLRRFHHAKRLQAAGGKYPEQIDRVIPSHTKFWGTEEAMEEGNPVGILDRGEAVEMPPVLYVQGADDIVHPKADLERFVASYRKRGGEVDLALYEGEGGGLHPRSGLQGRSARHAAHRRFRARASWLTAQRGLHGAARRPDA